METDNLTEKPSKKILSTAVLILFFAFLLFLCYLDFKLVILEKLYPSQNGGTDISEYGDAFLLVVVYAGVAAAAPYFAVFFISVFILILSLICFGFSVSNRKSRLKPVRITAIVLDCCFAVLCIAAIVAFILMREL